MTKEDIRIELEKIFKERYTWNGAEGPFTKRAIRRRELILLKEQLLYKIEEAKKWNDKYSEVFFLKIYEVINECLSLFK